MSSDVAEKLVWEFVRRVAGQDLPSWDDAGEEQREDVRMALARMLAIEDNHNAEPVFPPDTTAT